MECLVIGEKHAVVECQLGVDLMIEYDMPQFVREYHGQGGLVGQDVQHASADHNGVADGEGLERRGQQNAAAYFRFDVEIVDYFEIVDYGLQDLVDFAGRREQSHLLQPVYRILFRLALPDAGCLDRRRVLSSFALILNTVGRVDVDLRELLVPPQVSYVVAPKAGLRLEMQCRRVPVLEIRFLAVDVRRQPDSGLQIQAPAIKMQVVAELRMGSVRAVEAYDIEVAILDPDTAKEASFADVLLRLDVNHQAADFAKKFSPNEGEVVVLALKIGVDQDHLGKAQGQELH